MSGSVVSDSRRPCGLYPARLLCPWDSPGKNPGVGCHALLQGHLPDPGIEPRSPAWAGGFFTTSAHPGSPHTKLLMACSFRKTKPSAVVFENCSLKVILLQDKRHGWRGTTIHREFPPPFFFAFSVRVIYCSIDGFPTSLSCYRSSTNLPPQGRLR